MTIADKLRKVLSTKNALKQALIDKGVEVSDTDSFASYVDKIEGITGGGIPKGFTELQYLEKTVQDNSYVDLLYKATKDTTTVLNFSVTNWTSVAGYNPQAFFGHQGGVSTSSYGLFGVPIDTSDLATRYVHGASFGTRTSVSKPTIVPNQVYEYKLEPDKCSVDDVVTDTFSNRNDIVSDNLWLFRINAVSSVSSHYSKANTCVRGKIYNLKFYEGEELTGDLVPVRRNDTAVYGLYDKVTGYFLPVSLNSSFTGIAKE